MRKVLAVGAAAILLAVGVVAFASASTNITTATTFHVIAKHTQSQTIDLPPSGFSQGDEFVFHERLTNASGVVVGHDGGVCVTTFVNQAAHRAESQCTVTAWLDGRGQIAVQGLLSPPKSGVLAVNGGTGIFQNARGQVLVKFISNSSESLTFELIP
jgi:hypothetical protein